MSVQDASSPAESPTRSRRPVFRAIAIVVLLICLAILGALGTWQATKYLSARTTFALLEERVARPVDDVSSAEELDAELDYRRIRLRGGEFSNEQSFLVERRFHKNRPGFWVATPYVFEDGSAVVVQRGWVPEQSGPALAQDAPVPGSTPGGNTPIVGLVFTPDKPEPDALARENSSAGKLPAGDWTVLGELDAELIYEVLPYDAPPRRDTIVVLGRDFAGYWDHLPEPTHEHITEPYLTPAVHFGYATLWYGSGILLIWLFWAGWTGRLDPSAR